MDISLSVNNRDLRSSVSTGKKEPRGYLAVGTTHRGEATICIFILRGSALHTIFFCFFVYFAELSTALIVTGHPRLCPTIIIFPFVSYSLWISCRFDNNFVPSEFVSSIWLSHHDVFDFANIIL